MTKHQPDAELATYFREAGSWAGDRQAQTDRSKRIAWTIAGIDLTRGLPAFSVRNFNAGWYGFF